MYALRCAGVPYGFFDGSFGTGIQIWAKPTPRRIEAGIDLQHAPEAAHQQARADEEHERDGDLRRDQRAAKAALAAPFAAAAAGVLQVVAGIDARHLDRRHDAEHQRPRQSKAPEPIATMPPSKCTSVSRGRSAGIMAIDPVFQPRERDERGRAAGDRDDETLDEQLANELTARRAQRPAHRDLAHAARRPRQREVRDVHARDERAAVRPRPSARSSIGRTRLVSSLCTPSSRSAHCTFAG